METIVLAAFFPCSGTPMARSMKRFIIFSVCSSSRSMFSSALLYEPRLKSSIRLNSSLGCIIDGEAEVSISGKPLRAKEGDMVIMPANEPHALKALSPFKMLLVMIRA